MLYLKVHKTDKGDMIAMCDESLLGNIYTNGKVELNLKTYSDFYKGDLITKENALQFIDFEALYSANVVGKESVSIILDKGVADKSQVKTIEKVPYLQIFVMV